MKRHIMIVEDNATDMQKVTHILENDGFVAISARDAYSALDLSQKYRLDLAIVDIHLPNSSGFKLSKELKSRIDGKRLPIIMMSGTYKAKEDVGEALRAGASDFILKPIDSLVLSTKVASLLTNQMPWGEWPVDGVNLSNKGALEVEIEVLSISEMGIRIFSSVPLALQSSPMVEIPFLQDIGIQTPNLRVLDCKRLTMGFSCYLTFVGLSESDLKEIRILCRKLVTIRQ